MKEGMNMRYFLKRWCAGLLCMALGVLLPLGTMTAAAADIRPPAEAANLVVLIRFAGDQVGNADQPDTNLG